MNKVMVIGVLLLLTGTVVGVASINEIRVVVHFFYSKSCPHCAKEKPFLEKLESEYDWLEVRYMEISSNPENAQLFREMAEECGGTARGVPSTFICNEMTIGYGSDEYHGAKIRERILDCREQILKENGLLNVTNEGCRESDVNETMIELPFLGVVDSNSMSLPLFTIILGGLDGFNPCAFFVLFFLLSLLIHAKSRARMLLIGGIFVFFSGFIYFIFMAAWLNLFLFIGQMQAITLIAGIIALIVAAINIKDFFCFKKGISLTISDSAKPKLFTRMRNLMKATELPSMIFGTIFLAIAANTYELLCTAGFPMVYTRVLTLNNLPQAQYYLYLALYNIVYVIPLFAIVSIFTLTLGSRKLREEEGRLLKLLSGNMMMCLGMLLVLAPEQLNNILAAVGVLAIAAFTTTVFSLLMKLKSRGGNEQRKMDVSM